MKKILSILLLIAMLVPVFTSCNLIPSNEPEESSSQDSTPDTTITDTNNNNGNENTPPTTLTNEEKFNNASSLIAEGKYTEAYALLSEIKSYEPAKEKLKNFFYAPKTVDKKWKYSVENTYSTDSISYTYNSMGNIMETSNNEIFSYDANGNILSGCDLIYGTYYTYTYKDGKLYQQTSSHYSTTYYYDSNNRLSKTVSDNKYDIFEAVYEYTYYPNGKLKTMFDGGYEYHYNENEQIINVLMYDSIGTQTTATFSYGEYGVTNIDVNGYDEIIKFTYTYNENGMLTKLEAKYYYEGVLESDHIYTFSDHQLFYSENPQIQKRISIINRTDLDAALEIVE